MEALLAESLDALILKFRELGFDIVSATCVLTLDSGKITTISGGLKDVSAFGSLLVSIVAMTDLLDSVDSLDPEAKSMVAELKAHVHDGARRLDAHFAQHGYPTKPSGMRTH